MNLQQQQKNVDKKWSGKMSYMIKKNSKMAAVEKINGKMVFAYAHCTLHMYADGVELYKCVLMESELFSRSVRKQWA